jgi:hypothetical protein
MTGKGLLLGLREDKPNKSTDQGLVINDAVNMTSKIVLFISSSNNVKQFIDSSIQSAIRLEMDG